MKTTRNRLIHHLLLCTLATTVCGSQLRLPVTSSNSTLEVELCVQGTCDTQSSSVGGFVVVALDDNCSPNLISLRNFDLQATSNYNFHLDYGFLGDIIAHARNLRIFHATPGPAQPVVGLGAGQYSFTNVPFLTRGTADYTASGLICATFQANGRPCSTNLDFSTLGQNTIAEIPGTIRFTNGMVIVHFDFIFTSPIDPSNPGLGTISGHSIINASGPINTSLIPPGSDWRYLDTGIEPAANWSLPGFNDSAWGFGPAQLGYGDGDEVTVVSYGPAITNKYITTWFRHAFNLTNASIYTNLAMRVLRDDGVIVYLNGAEIFRDNMLMGSVTPATPAVNAVAGAAESTFYVAPLVGTTSLQSGQNVLAAEVHQSAPDSSDLGFDLELVGLLPSGLSISRVANGYLLRWPSAATRYAVFAAGGLTPPVSWQRLTLMPADDGMWKSFIVPNSGATRFFRLTKD